MRPLGLGEHGDVGYSLEGGSTVAVIYYRDYSGRRRRVKRAGKSKADARRKVLRAVQEVLAAPLDSEFSRRSLLADGAKLWIADFESLVVRGKRSPTTLDMYRYVLERHVISGVGSLRLGELTTARLDRFLRSIQETNGYAAAKMCRQVLSGICGLLVRLDALSANPVRDVSRLEVDHDRTARSMTPQEVRGWLALLDGHPFAVRHDLPELARFMLATGLRLGEALGVRWSDVDPERGTVRIERTVIRVKGQGLRTSRLKSRASFRVLNLPSWCVVMLKSRRIRFGVIEGPVFPDARGGYRDRNNVAGAFRHVRAGSEFEWVRPHTLRKTVATILDGSGATARLIADQLGHARITMTQDVYMGRQVVSSAAAEALQAI